VAKSLSFEVIESDQAVAIAVHKGDPFSISKMFMSCLPFTSYVGSGAASGYGGTQELAEDDDQSSTSTSNQN
jgi:hypothetical protein